MPWPDPRVQSFATHQSVRAYAPGGIGNMGPGLDILGCAVTGAGDVVHATRIETPGVRVDDPGHLELPTNPARHASAIAAWEVLRRAGTPFGLAIRVEKGLPLSGGQGGSAASAIAGAVAANALLPHPLSSHEVLRAALVAEERLSGRHIDNLAPALYGGIVLIRSIEPLHAVRVPVPASLRVVLVRPDMRLRTAESRAVLPGSVDRVTALGQAACVATMIAAFESGDLSVLRGAVDDRIAEPARAALLPGFTAAKRAALDAGALGCSISGGGPSAFALVDGDDAATPVVDAMVSAYASAGVVASARVARIDERGAYIQAVDDTPVDRA